MSWHVTYSDTTHENGTGPCCLSIGPHEEDTADAFAFSQNFPASNGVPDDVEAKFNLMAAAPELLAALRELVKSYEHASRYAKYKTPDDAAAAYGTYMRAREAILKAEQKPA